MFPVDCGMDSWYLRGVSNKLGLQIPRYVIPGRLLGWNQTPGRESKDTESARETLHTT